MYVYGVYMYDCKGVSYVFRCMLQWFRTRSCDLDPLREIRSCTRYGSDTQAIRKPTNGMIWRFVPVRAVETRRRFGSKIASFHVSVSSCLFSYLPLSVGIYILLVSFQVTVWLILLVWLPIFFHEISVSAHPILLFIWAFINIIVCVEDYDFWL